MHATVVNTKHVHGAPNFEDEIPFCLNQQFGTFGCTQNHGNVILSGW